MATVGLLGVAVGASLAASPLAAAQLRSALGRPLAAESVQIDVAASPPPAVWWGRIDRLRVAMRHLHAGQLEVEAFDAVLDGIRFDPASLYLDRMLAIRSIRSGAASLTVTRDALTRTLAAQLQAALVKASPVGSALGDAGVTLERGRLELVATASAFGTVIRIMAEGRLVLRAETAVDLVLDRLTIAGVDLPRAITAQVADAVNPILDVRLWSLPFGLRLTKIQVDGGRVVLDAIAGGS